jgi:hypothetical protein
MKLTRRIIIAGAMNLLCASAGAEPTPQTQVEVGCGATAYGADDGEAHGDFS